MCEQTEISYLDGDVVWVKLGASWWPGQVTGVHNLPEDIQEELKKKPLIAAVKFFQEDTYEFVKNYQQIYKYNCTLKDDFIKKGLDKYRTKSKDGSSYMDKFPGDVEMAEKLTGGDADIISSHKFTRQQKPDISALFGEKKIPKKKRDRDDEGRERRNDGGNSSDIPSKKITHPRFLKESDHEVRIRQQPASLSSTPTNNTGSPQYVCYVCNFTSSRLNVIILHNKTHSSGSPAPVRAKVKTYLQPKPKTGDNETPKRKYTKKEKGDSNRARKDITSEAGKRKYTKLTEKANKKKKPDPELREKLLADWEDESDNEMDVDVNKSMDTSSVDSSPVKSQINSSKVEPFNKEQTDEVSDENDKILLEAKNILNETESLSAIISSPQSTMPKKKKSKLFSSETDSEKGDRKSRTDRNAKLSVLEKEEKKVDSETDDKSTTSEKNNKKTGSEKDDKKSRLSCFDFDEEDLPEPTIPPVRKIPRVFGDKNLSLKKEIIKEFEMSQALKNDQQNDAKDDKNVAGTVHEESLNNFQVNDEVDQTDLNLANRVEKIDVNICETELEIVEIFEVEKEEDSTFDETSFTAKSVEVTTKQPVTLTESTLEAKDTTKEKEDPILQNDESTVKQKKMFELESISTDTDRSQPESVLDEPGPESVPMEVNNTSPVIAKKRHGRSKRNVMEKITSDNIKSLENNGKPAEPAKITLEFQNKPDEFSENLSGIIKTSDQDGLKPVDSHAKVSNFGRKRRSARKSSKTDALFLSVDHKTSNEDSQSELDDRLFNVDEQQAHPKRKGKKGRKPVGFPKQSIVATEILTETDDKLLEELNKPADSVSEDEMLSKPDGKPTKQERKTRRGKRPVRPNKKVAENLGESTEDDIISESHIELSIEPGTPAAAKLVTDASREIELENKPYASMDEKSVESKTSSMTMDVSELSQTPSESVDAATENIIIEETVIIEESAIEETVIETIEHEVASSHDAEIDQVPLEALPPKKSQIKKFELSQIDFFENDASVEKAVIQPEPEKRIDKMEEVEEMEVEITRVNPNEQIVEMVSEKIIVDEGTLDIKEEVEVSENAILKIEKQVNSDNLTTKQILDEHPEVTIERDNSTDGDAAADSKAADSSKLKTEETTQKIDKNELEIELVSKEIRKTTVETPLKRSSMQTRYKGKFTPDTGAKPKKDKDGSLEEKPVNTFQEAFLKTLQIDNLKRDKKMIIDEIEITVGRGKKAKKPNDVKTNVDVDNINIVPVVQTVTQDKDTELVDSKDVVEKVEEILEAAGISTISGVSDFEGVEVVVEENIENDVKLEEHTIKEIIQHVPEAIIEVPTSPAPIGNTEEISKTLSLDVSKLDEASRAALSTPLQTLVAAIPVKKREKPRIIESVSLKEPMHILKSKLLEKVPGRGTKHKLETDTPKRGEAKHTPRAKVMKMENSPSNSKARSTTKVSSPHLSLTKKLEALKAEEAATANLMEAQSEKVIAQTSQCVSSVPVTEKLIQQSSQCLADMELDINSMPFVLSEDVLTPESIEQMPVVISSLIPSSSSITTSTISLTPTTQMVTSSQGQFKVSNETAIETTPTKKKSGTPAILKNKGKGKPTITSVKTIVPPLTGGVKGLKFQNAQAGKVSPLISQKGQPGKYVIVQTAGGQQVRYSVQGKPGSQQKIAIPAGKGSASAQIVQQGGKVVILTSPQSGQTKMIPLNTSKTLGTKMQRIMTSKGQIFAPISPQGVLTSKTILAPKSDVGSPTTSKVTQGQKIIGTQGISPKGVLTPIPGTISKSTILGTLSQGILTKGAIYTPISAASLSGKAIISSKGIVTSKGTTILSPLTSQGLVTSKGTILAPISQSLGGKTILSTQGIVGSKGTVLTPITGQQVKAIAAKSPSKGAKIQYQTVQQKMQLPLLQKTQKIPITSSQMRVLGSLKSPGSTILLQNTVTGQKTLLTGKKMIKQVLAQQQSQVLPALTAQSGFQQASPSVLPQGQHTKGKLVSGTQQIPKVVIPRSTGRQSKSQQKIVVQKMQQEASLQSSSSKLSPNVSQLLTQTKHMPGGNTPATKASAKSYVGVKGGQQKRNLLNAALNSIYNPPPVATVTRQVSLPTLEPIDAEKKFRVQETIEAVVSSEEPKLEQPSTVDQLTTITEKMEEPKVTAQPQIMALPTESGDGTQTYVLVTIDEQGQIQPLDNNTLMSLEGTTQNPDGTRTLYIDPSSLGEAGTLDNIVLQFDNGSITNLPSTVGEPTQTMITDSFRTSEIIPTSNQDILAAALANTDFQQEIGLPDNPTASVMTTGLTQTSLINQTILQSTIIPPTEPISSPAVLETSLTLNQPIMTPLEVPSNLAITTEPSTSVVPTIPSSLELPLTITNPSIAYISAGAAQIQIPGNSMPDIGEIMETSTVMSHSEPPVTSQYLVLPNLDKNITIDAQGIQSDVNTVPTVSYSVSIPENIVLEPTPENIVLETTSENIVLNTTPENVAPEMTSENIVMETTPVQTTPSMPIIDDTYNDDVSYTIPIETPLSGDQSFVDVPVSEMLVSKASTISTENGTAQNVTVTSEMIVSADETAISSEELGTVSHIMPQEIQEVSISSQDVYTSHEVPITTEELILQQTAVIPHEQIISHDIPVVTQEEPNQESTIQTEDLNSIEMHNEHAPEIEATSMPLIEETCTVTSESNVEIQSETSTFQVNDSSEIPASTSYDIVPTSKLGQLLETTSTDDKPCAVDDDQTAISNETELSVHDQSDILPIKSLDNTEAEHMDVEPSHESYAANEEPVLKPSQTGTASSEGDHNHEIMSADSEINFEEGIPETSQEIPSQSYEQFDVTMTSDSLEIPSQSVNKSENSPEPTQSVSYESMEIDENNTSVEPPTQSFEDSKQSEATQSYETSIEIHGNAPTQSFNEIMHNEDRNSSDELVDDQSFPTQSYEVGKLESLSENMETDAEISQEGNIPSQSNDIGTDGIGTSSNSTNNSGANEDETASSSYVPETPENQERDQDQESAISTSSYEIPPCEELNIASSSVIPDTSVRGEHMSIHDNGVPEIPTSSYNLNPDSSSTHVDAVPTSSYEDQIVLEQNVSTSYEVPISMPGLEENSSQSFVTESSDHRNEPTSYYTHHQEVTASYYESVHQESNSRLEEDPQEEVTASYYESNPQDIASEASQSYFAPEEATPSYSTQSITPSYYNPRPESEATQSFYSTQALDRREQSSSQNVEASQSFYPEVTENLRLRQQGEATPTYSARYPVDYTLTDSPIERHDLVESSVPATRPTER